MKTGLSNDEMVRICAALEAVPAVEKAVLFGSRAMGLARSNSDVDILLYGDALQTRDVLRVASLLDATTLPYQFDLIRYDANNADLLNHVGEYGKVIFQRRKIASQAKPIRKISGVASEWQTLSLRDAGIVLIDCDHRTPTAVESGYPYVTIPQMRNGHIDISDARRITTADFVEWTRKAKPIANDVILSRRCNPGETAWVPHGLEFALGQNLVLLRADGVKVFPPFLRWLVRSPKWWEQIGVFLNVGAVFNSLKCADVPKFMLQIPPLPEQYAIAHILGTLDDKIELNRRMNETLEAMARALFKAWFVDFEPVRAKLEGRWRRGQSLPGLPAHLYDLFPGRLVESELGGIPEEWKIAPLSKFASLNPESWTKKTRPDEINYIDLSNTKWGQIESIAHYFAETAPSRAQRILRPLDTIIGTVRPGNGSYSLIANEGLTGSTGFAVLRPFRREYTELVYISCTSQENIQILANLADGGAYPAVHPEVILATQICYANEYLIQNFSSQTAPMFACIAENERLSHSLTQLRDTLLPKLISGKISIEQIERNVARGRL